VPLSASLHFAALVSFSVKVTLRLVIEERQSLRLPGRSVVSHQYRIAEHQRKHAMLISPYTSTIIVTGPSLTRATPMQAPKTPFFAPSRSQKRS
jgi:hypothetical protein